MEWTHPQLLLLALPAILLLTWIESRSSHPMPACRRRWLWVVRSLAVLALVAAAAGPTILRPPQSAAAVLIVDESESMGQEGVAEAWRAAGKIISMLPNGRAFGIVSASETPHLADSTLLNKPPTSGGPLRPLSPQTDLASAVRLASALLPSDSSRHIVLLTDGWETRGSLDWVAREAAIQQVRLHVWPVAGPGSPDARLVALRSNASTVNLGATISLTAVIESSFTAKTSLRLYENGQEIERRVVSLTAGQTLVEEFQRSPSHGGPFAYRAVLEGAAGETISTNNEALAVVEVHGQPLVLYIEGEPAESHFLAEAMLREGIRFDVRSAAEFPTTLAQLASYDGIIFSDVPAQTVGDSSMAALRTYVGQLGGGFLMIGGRHSFGAGGYVRTPVEDLLPLGLTGEDDEEQQSVALALVLDRSGSMTGQKLTLCKSAAAATAEILTRKDSLGVYAFDSAAQIVAPMAPVTDLATLQSQISSLSAGGGTHLRPALDLARADLAKTPAKIKHVIALTDGQTDGDGYEALAAQCFAEGITISTVAIGGDAASSLLQGLARAGGGQAYETTDPASIVRIFTQDTLLHAGRILREEPFSARTAERHPMLAGWEGGFTAPPLLGYVKTIRKPTAQILLTTDSGDPLLTTWRYELGRVTAFTSDCKSRWAAFWLKNWTHYPKFWAQVLRETLRPPQDGLLGVQLHQEGDQLLIAATAMENAVTFDLAASVQAEVRHFSAQDTTNPSLLQTMPMEFSGAGRYTSSIPLLEAGAYLVRIQAGPRHASAHWIFAPQAEIPAGVSNDPLLRKVTGITGGSWLGPDSSLEPLQQSGFGKSVRMEIWKGFVFTFFALLLTDTILRRWDHLRALFAN